MLAAGLNAERQPSDARRTQQRKLAHFDGVHTGVRPDVEFRSVGFRGEKLADAPYMTVIQDEHLIDDFVSLDAVRVVETINFIHHPGGIPHAVAIHSEWRVDAAERALEGTAQGSVDGGVRLTGVDVSEALPVVR